MTRTTRDPRWSRRLTDPLAGHIPSRARRGVLVAIKAFHSAAFFTIAALIVLVAWDGVRGQPRRRTGAALAVGLGESAIFATNNLVCPLTPLAEQLGAQSGSVTDIYLPDWVSRRIPAIFGTLLVAGVLLNIRALRASRAS